MLAGVTRLPNKRSKGLAARGLPFGIVLRGLCLALTTGLVLAASCVLPATVKAMPPSPDLAARAARNEALAARLKAFERNAKMRGVNAPGRLRSIDARDASGAAGVPSRNVASATGRLRTLALLVDFADSPHLVEASIFDDLLFADVFGPTSVRGYFREISYGTPDTRGLLDVVTDDLPSDIGWIRLPGTLASYVSGGNYGTGSYPGNAQKMVEDAVAAADPTIDFSVYDADADGFVENLVVVHAGIGAEYTGSSSHIWSHQWTTSQALLVDGVRVSTYSTGPEYWRTPGDMTVGVFAHEIGHILGLPDLYDRDYSSGGVGNWSLMGSGSWNGDSGDSPARLDAWSAARLGWLQPTVVDGPVTSQTLTAVNASRTGGAVQVFPAAGGGEYFLIENRQQTGTDAALPGAGLLIWHIDEAQLGLGALNDDETHKLVDLEEAGGVQDLDLPWPGGFGSSDDPFPGTAGARLFSDATMPSAHTYQDVPSGVIVSDISDGAVITAGIGAAPPSDVTAPVIQVTGAKNGAHYRRSVTLTVTADDGPAGSGVATVSCSLDGAPFRVVEGPGLQQVVAAVPNGAHVIVYRAMDRAGNRAQGQMKIKTDTIGPVGTARQISVLRGRYVSVPYKLSDQLSSKLWQARVVIKRKSGALVRTFRVPSGAYRWSGKWYGFSWRPKDRGTYRYWVYGQDTAGNDQRIRGYGTITVR